MHDAYSLTDSHLSHWMEEKESMVEGQVPSFLGKSEVHVLACSKSNVCHRAFFSLSLCQVIFNFIRLPLCLLVFTYHQAKVLHNNSGGFSKGAQ